MDPVNPPSQKSEPFEYPQGSSRGYYVFIAILIFIVIAAGIALVAISKFTKSLNTSLKTAVSVKQSYENPFTTEAQAYENPFNTTSATPTTDTTYQNPFQ